MIRKINKIFSLFLILAVCLSVLFCASCEGSIDDVQLPEVKSQKIKLREDSGITCVANGNIIYYVYNNVKKACEYFEYNIAAQTETFLGDVPRVTFTIDTPTAIGNQLYFYVVRSDEKQENEFISLVCLDLEKKICKLVEDHLDLYQNVSYTAPFQDDVLLLKGDLTDNQTKAISYIDIYRDGVVVPLIEETITINGKEMRGTDILMVFSDNESIFAMVKIYDEKGAHPYINKYDPTGKLIGQINADCVSKLLTNAMIAEIQYLGNGYIYIANFSNYGLFCKIQEDKLETVDCGQENNGYTEWVGPVVSQYLGNNQYHGFFHRIERWKSSIFDTRQGKLIPFDYKWRDGEEKTIWQIYSDAKGNYLVLYSVGELTRDTVTEIEYFSVNSQYLKGLNQATTVPHAAEDAAHYFDELKQGDYYLQMSIAVSTCKQKLHVLE